MQTQDTDDLSDDSDSFTSFGEVKPGWKPEIGHLPDAVQDGKFTPVVGDKIVIQYPQLWRDTTLWVVSAIEPPGIDRPGHLRLWDPNTMSYGMTNYIDGPTSGQVIKVADQKQRWVPYEGEDLKTRMKRKARRPNFGERVVELLENPSEEFAENEEDESW